MLTLRQSPFDRIESDLFQKLEQQLHNAERIPAAEVRESESSYTIRLELPGVERSTIDVKASDRNLVISADRTAPQNTDQAPLLSEFRYGTWSRSFRFASGLNREGITAQFRDGVLTVEAPKSQNLTSVRVEVSG